MSVYENIPKPGAPYDSRPNHHKRHEHDIVNFYIGTTRGNTMWDLTWVYASEPLIPRGPDGSFDKDMIFPASQIVTHSDRHWIYYNGFRERHGIADRGPHSIGLATLKLDRFISLSTKGTQFGSILTKPFQLAGSRLQVNANGEHIRVEMLDENAKKIPGHTAQSGKIDALRWEPEWANGRDLAALKGKLVRLRFQLRNAKLFAFQFINPGPR